MTTKPFQVLNYAALACLYDTLMKDIDYESWADFIDEVMQTHHSNPVHIHEMACGTGSLALSLEELDCYTIHASDISEQMLEIAEIKAKKVDSDIIFFPMSFLNLNYDHTYDIVFSAFDSINYLLEPSEVLNYLKNSVRLLKPGGLLIFDFTTPQNSLEAVDYLNNEEVTVGNVRYFRTSSFDIKKQLHYNQFEIERLDPDTNEVTDAFQELHCQRVYTLKEMLSIVEQSPYHLEAKYDGFDLVDANENSARITMVLSCPTLR